MPADVSTRAAHEASPGELRFREYLLILVEVALILVVTWQFKLETRHFLFPLLALTVGGFAVHALLPSRWRLGFFVVVSLAGMVSALALGGGSWIEALRQTVYGLAVAAALITTARLPARFEIRLILLVLLTALLFWLRGKSLQPFWAVIGAMFMFRMVSYMYYARRQREKPSLLMTCAYFFVLPNSFFAFMPILDFKGFCDSHQARDRRKTYQTGVHWIAIGLVHLLTYRLIRQELLPNPLEIRTGRELALFFAMNYALYVRVSGIFHLICGMLHLFGFDLPRTHDNYFLASSFSDIWRRINIYWKNFLMRVFFFPAFFFLRKRGIVVAVCLGVLWAFSWTWLSHAWQQYWPLGVFPLRLREGVLWLVVGSLVAVNALWDYSRSAAQTSPPSDLPFHPVRAALWSLQVVGVFSCVSLFWARWNAPLAYKLLVKASWDAIRGSERNTWLTFSSTDALVIGGVVAAAVTTGVIGQYIAARSRQLEQSNPEPSSARALFERSVVMHLGLLAAILLVAQPPVSGIFGAQVSAKIAALQKETLLAGDVLAHIEGYYEQLNDANVLAGPAMDDVIASQRREGNVMARMLRDRDDVLMTELIPGSSGELLGKLATINRWGMRDKDRNPAKPPGVFRIAAVGSSLVMGYGVADDEVFTRVLEDRLNAASGPEGMRFEVLNFGVSGYYPVQRRAEIEKKVLAFDPDLILYFAHQEEFLTVRASLGELVKKGVDLEDDCLNDLVDEAGISPLSTDYEVYRGLDGKDRQVLECTYRRLEELSKRTGIPLVYVFLPVPTWRAAYADPIIVMDYARTAGLPTIDLSDWWGDLTEADVMIGRLDEQHANPRGHRLIAAALEKALTPWLAAGGGRSLSNEFSEGSSPQTPERVEKE